MTELQNDRVTEWQNDRQDKNNMPPDLRSRWHKKYHETNTPPKKTTKEAKPQKQTAPFHPLFMAIMVL